MRNTPEPSTAADVHAPAPGTAYVGAPTTLREINWVLRKVTERPFGAELPREFWLRKAAVLDRIALIELEDYGPGRIARDAARTAEDAARRLADYDRKHGTSAGRYRPDAAEWTPSHRPYVRQEYAAHRSA